jgi:hypothetical protein
MARREVQFPKGRGRINQTSQLRHGRETPAH